MFATTSASAIFAAPARLRAPAPRSVSARPVCRATNGNGSYVNPLRPSESPEQAAARRERETARVRERTKVITGLEQLQREFASAPDDQLFILAVTSVSECYLGDNPEGAAALDNSKVDRQVACNALQDALHRVARDCANVTFLEFVGDATAEAKALSQELGVKHFPTVQYWKNGDILWQTVGAAASGFALGENLLFFGGRDSKTGESTVGLVDELHNESELAAFFEACAAPQENLRGVTVAALCEKQIAVVNVSMGKNSPGCVHIYPAVVALAKNTAGAVRWGRLLADSSPKTTEMMKNMKVDTVPSFVFFADGKEVGRYSGADRGQLMSAVLEIQKRVGYKLPEPPVRKRLGTAEAKKIAAERRAQEKAQQGGAGWTH